MTACGRWQEILDPFAEAPDPGTAEHLAGCAACREALARWRFIGDGVPGAADVDGAPSLDDARVLRGIHDRIAPAKTNAAVSALRAAVASAVACAAIAVLAVFWVSQGAPAQRRYRPAVRAPGLRGALVAEGTFRRDPISPRLGDEIRVPAGSRAVLESGGHTIGAAPGTALRVARLERRAVHVALADGVVACDVDFAGGGGDFTVEAGDVVVRVEGTTFSVAHDAGTGRVVVAVAEGRVEVRAGTESRAVGEGESVGFGAGGLGEPVPIAGSARGEIAALLRGEAAPSTTAPALPTPAAAPADSRRGAPREISAPSLRPGAEAMAETTPRTPEVGPDAWRAWVLAGRYPEAEAAISEHLRANPGDVSAWELLADCRRKSGNGAGAVDAYRRIVSVGTPAEARLARFKAGALCQDRLGRQADAAELFSGYLEGTGPEEPLRAEALTRCGRALAALGRPEEARRMLTEVVERHAANPVAAEARRILEGLGP